jgi:hypothetical protein
VCCIICPEFYIISLHLPSNPIYKVIWPIPF